METNTANPSLADQLKGITESNAALLAKVGELEAQVKTARDQARAGMSGVPFARRGENSMSSRGYSYAKLFGVLGGVIAPEHAKVEIDMGNRLSKLYGDMGFANRTANSVMAPFAGEFLAEIPGQEGFAAEMSEVTKAGVAGFDPYEARHTYGRIGLTKALSWLDNTAGEALIAPPTMGELITLLRNNEVLMRAGARNYPLPPSGSLVLPRHTSASTAYWVGQSSTITASDVATGDVTLRAKKLAAINEVPNELFRFASISIEAFLREDLSRVLALKMDKSLLEAVGSQYEPKGLINYAGITSHTASTTDTNGNTFTPEDVAKMIAKVEEKNASFRTFVMRPLMYAALVNRRADAVTAADGKGQFVFNILRGMGEGMGLDRDGVGNLYGYPAFKSTQISNARVKGSGTDLSYILGGDFNDYVIGMHGALEFLVNNQNTAAFTTDQTHIRSILHCDGAPVREASFILCDQLLLA